MAEQWGNMDNIVSRQKELIFLEDDKNDKAP